MTSALARSRPEDLLRAGALLGATADSLGTAGSACRRSAAVRWVGRPNERYQSSLAALARSLASARSAFDEACEALLLYARALSAAQELAVEADALAAVSSDALADRAVYLRAQAEQDEWVAASRLVCALEDLTARAPRVGAATVVSQDIAHFAAGAVSALSGVGALVGAAGRSLPFVGSSGSRHEARGELGQAALDALQPWKMVEDLWDALREGHGFEAGGSLSMGLVLRSRGARGRTVELFGSHDRLPLPVVLALQRGADVVTDLDAYALARVQKQLATELLRLENLPLPDLEALLRDGVDLMHHEAAGGHTILKHVGRDEDFLRLRQRTERRRDGSLQDASSFSTFDDLERAVTRALDAAAPRIEHWLTHEDAIRRKVTVPLPDLVGLVARADGTVAEPRAVVLELQRVADGTIRVHSVYLAP